MLQLIIIVANCLCAVIGTRVLYAHHRDDDMFFLGLTVFIAGPVVLGVLQGAPHRALLKIASIGLLMMPAAYAVTDPLLQQFERVRDAYFLATLCTIEFVAAVWLADSLRRDRVALAAASAVSLLAAAAGIYVLVFMIVQFE
jgi:hypothetical protein